MLKETSTLFLLYQVEDTLT
jgi:hypothetical protein